VSFAEGLVGVTLDGRYRLEAVLGEGGMGAVYRATHLAMERKVAVKLLKPHLTSDDTALQRFAREARSTMRVDSPHAVKVLDFGVTPMSDYYMVLEYLDGRTVQRELDIDGCFDAKRTVHIARQALHALGAAHAAGIVHRDIKPDNLLLMRQGDDPDYTKVLDFGVAKLMEGATRTSKELALTAIGTVFGTPELMSPEQACGHPLDGRSDLYSLAATLFAMLTGRGLYVAGSPIEWLTCHVKTPPPHLADVAPELARYPELDAVLQRCLAKHRDQRPRTASELEAMFAEIEPTLSRVQGDTPTPSQRVTIFSGSSFFSALPQAAVDPELKAESSLISPSESVAPIRSRRGLWLALGGLVVIAVIGIAIGVVATKTSRTASIGRDASMIAALPDAVAIDAAVDAAVLDARPPVDAVRAHDAPKGSPKPPPQPDPHLQAAEEALRTNNRLRQLAEADLALRANPRNVRAKFLLADALIKTGDSTRGCQYLRALKRYRPAVARAGEAGCGTD
jgi:serine/threonine-protein kinase